LQAFVDRGGESQRVGQALLEQSGQMFGTQSETGSRFVERVLTAVTTLRQQERDVLDYLTEACAAATSGGTFPSLLPLPPPVNAVA